MKQKLTLISDMSKHEDFKKSVIILDYDCYICL